MSKSRDHMTDDFDDMDVLNGSDVDSFIDTMEDRHSRSGHSHRAGRSGRQRLDDYRESRWLRDQLQDWDDWD